MEAAMFPVLGLEMAQHHFGHMLLVKASNKARPDLVGGEIDSTSYRDERR